MSESNSSKHHMDDEIDLMELFAALWSGKWLISAITSVAAILSIVIALWLPTIYVASALLAPAEGSGGGLSGLMKQYGGLASLAGVSLPGGDEGSRTQLGMQIIKSRAFIGGFVERRDISPQLMAVDAWDESTGTLTLDSDRYDMETQLWKLNPDTGQTFEPSDYEVYKALSSSIGISQDPQTGFVTVSVEHQSPVLAAQWVDWLVRDVNDSVKAQEVAEAKKSIEYLQQQVEDTPLSELQAVFFDLIQKQTEIMMLAEARQEFVFKTIDPSFVPEERERPNRSLICIVGTILGMLFGILIVALSYYNQKSRMLLSGENSKNNESA